MRRTANPTSGTVTVSDSVPAGLTLVSIGGTGWTCTLSTAACATANPLAPGASYPPIVVTVNVADNAPPQVNNQVALSGGGSGNSGASELTNVIPFTCAITGDSVASVVDAQMIINEALGAQNPVHDLTHDQIVNVVDIQKLIDAILGLPCVY